MSESMSAEQFRRLYGGAKVVGHSLRPKSSEAAPRRYSKRQDKPKSTRAGGVVRVIVTSEDCD